MPSLSPTPPATGTQLPSSPIWLLLPPSTTGQHQSIMKAWATSSSGANSELTPLFWPPGTLPMQTNLATYAKAYLLDPMPANKSRAPTPFYQSSKTRSQLSAGKSPTPRLFERSIPRRGWRRWPNMHHHWRQHHSLPWRHQNPHWLNRTCQTHQQCTLLTQCSICHNRLKDFYLNTPPNWPEYVHIKITNILKEFIAKYQLKDLVCNGWVYFEMCTVMYGLPHAGILANNLLQDRMTWAMISSRIF